MIKLTCSAVFYAGNNWEPGNFTFFKVKRSTRMAKVVNAFAARKGIPASSLACFTQKHHQVQDQETPLALGLEDQDVLLVS